MQDFSVKRGHIVRHVEQKLVLNLGQTADLGGKSL